MSDDNLAPRFHQNALIYNTQWESFAVNEISYNEGRLKYFGVEEAGDHYERLLGMAFKKMSELLKDDGLLVTYFAHSSPEAWIELIEAGWKRAGLSVCKAWNFATESAQRVTARGKTALESSIVVVWRKRLDGEKVGEFQNVYREAVENAKKAKESATNSYRTVHILRTLSESIPTTCPSCIPETSELSALSTIHFQGLENWPKKAWM